MNYQEIKEKYSAQVQEKKHDLQVAENKIIRIEAQIQAYAQNREQYRGQINADASQNWQRLSRKIMQLNADLTAAKDELNKIRLGTANAESLKKIAKDMDDTPTHTENRWDKNRSKYRQPKVFTEEQLASAARKNSVTNIKKEQ